jgi:hypothetical protein
MSPQEATESESHELHGQSRVHGSLERFYCRYALPKMFATIKELGALDLDHAGQSKKSPGNSWACSLVEPRSALCTTGL